VWEFLIVLKMVLAAVLTILLFMVVIKDDAENPRLDRRTGFYLLMVLVAIGLGYSGGELQYG
jgi:heme A synthase